MNTCDVLRSLKVIFIKMNIFLHHIYLIKQSCINACAHSCLKSFKKLIQFLECSWNHAYFGSLAK